MDLGLHGRRALITGGSRGIGFAVAEALAAEGAAVGLVARDAAGLAAAAERLGSRGVLVATAVADVTDTPQLRRAVDDIATALGGLDHLVANAGGTVGPGNLTRAGDDDFTATFALNAGHAAELIRAGLTHLRAAGGGSVVIISSITGMRPAPRTAYAAAKAAEIHTRASSSSANCNEGFKAAWRLTRLSNAGEQPLPNPNCASSMCNPGTLFSALRNHPRRGSQYNEATHTNKPPSSNKVKLARGMELNALPPRTTILLLSKAR